MANAPGNTFLSRTILQCGSPTYFLGGKYNALFSETRPILEHSNIVLMASLYS